VPYYAMLSNKFNIIPNNIIAVLRFKSQDRYYISVQ
jgi:hypothetical protein